MSTCAFSSTSVHLKRDNIYNFVACAGVVVLFSNLCYALLTTAQCLVSGITGVCSRSSVHRRRNHALRDMHSKESDADGASVHDGDTDNTTLARLITHTIDFKRDARQARISITREELWRMLYPLALGFYVLFLCIPVYDATCTVCLSMGFFVHSSYAEIYRGIHFRRPTTRKVIFWNMAMWGLLVHCVVFVFVYAAGAQSTREGWHSGRSFLSDLKDLHALVHNITFDGGNTESASEVAHLNGNSTMASILLGEEVFKVQDGSVSQYMTWSENAYPQRMWMLWVLCAGTPLLLQNAPAPLRLPVVIEATQNAVSSIALLSLCLVSRALDTSVFSLLDTQSALGDMYLVLSGGSVWLCVHLMLQAVRERNSVYMCCIILALSFAKTAVQHWQLLRGKQVYEIFVCACCLLVIYTCAAICFVRKENIAVRSGWGSPSVNDNLGESDDDLEMELGQDSVGALYTIEEVIATAQKTITESKSILNAPPSSPPKKKTDAHDTPRKDTDSSEHRT